MILRTSALLFGFSAMLPQLHAQTTFRITSASPHFLDAGANGTTITLAGTLPTASTQAANPVQVCFYTGYGSTAAITPSLPDGSGNETVIVPASTIQNIPASVFTAANVYSLNAQVYFVAQGTVCDGTFNATLTNSVPVLIGAPYLTGVVGPTNVPQTNSATGLQAAPANIVLSGFSFDANTIVNFGSFGNATPIVVSRNVLDVPVPSAFASSPVGTTATLAVCPSSTPGGVCPSSFPVTVTVTALAASTGTITATPTPVSTTGTTVLSAQFKKSSASAGLPEPGAPSGLVTFTTPGNATSTAPLVLDSTATLVPVATTTQVATTATPTISPAAGTYPSTQIVTLLDLTPRASIYYTLDGSTPTANSTLYAGAITVSTTTTVTAIAISPGYLPSASASSTFTIFVPIPTSVAFVQQPTTSPINTAIAPPITVEILDQNGNLIPNSTLPVTIYKGTDPDVQTDLGGTTTVNAVNGIATFSDLTLDQIGNGFTFVASSGSLATATSNAFNITPYPITVQLFNPLIGVTSTLPGTFTLTHPAPQGGVTVNLASDQTGFVTVSPASVNVPAGGTGGSFTYTGIAPGLANISASATGYLAGSSSVTATNSLVSLGTIQPVAPGQTISLALSIATNAPAGGVTVNFTSSNPGVATVTSSVFIPAGQRTAATNPQIVGVTIGSTTINATAQGYAPDTRNVNVTVTATFSPTSVTIPHATSSTTTLNITAPAQVGGLTFTLSSDNTAKATVVTSVTIPQGQTSVLVPITGVADGSTTIRADSPGVTEATLTVNVSSQLSFYYGNNITGVNMQVTNYAYLPSAPTSPITVTVTSNGPTISTISSSGTVVGGTTLTFTNVTSSGTVGPISIQGQVTGTTTLTVSAPGYTTGSNTITVYPSGFSFAGTNNGGLATTTFSNPSNVTVYPTILNPTTLTYYTTGTLNPGIGPISVPVTSSNTATGTITTSPVVFHGGDTSQTTTFKPGSAGTTTVSLGTATGATGISTSSQYTSFTATVTAPQLSFYYGNNITGVNMMVTNYAYLPVAPPSPVTVTVTSSGPAISTISSSGTVVGGTTLTFTNVSAAGTVGPIYIQGQTTGTTTLTVSVPGYTDGTNTITVYPSGFSFAGSFNGGLSTTTFSTPTNITVYPTLLNPSTLTYYTTGTLNPGIGPISVPVTSSNTATGTITTSPLVFNPGDTSKATTFQPSAAGTSTIALGTATGATGISTSAQYTSFTATVTAPQATFYYGNQIVGVNMQITNYVYLPVAPPSPITITVSTNNGATIAAISKSGTVVGGGTTLTFTNVTGSGTVAQFFIQGQAVGTTTLTLTATGYTGSSNTVSVYPSGFTLAGSYNGGLSTTTFSSPSNIPIYPTVLNPGTLTYNTTGTLSPGLAPITVPVTSSNTVVGTISGSPVTFNPGDSSNNTAAFQPTSAGMTTVTIGAPTGVAGFSTPAQYTQFVATVTAPQATFYYGNDTVGANMQTYNYGYLPVAPPNPVTVTITSNGPSIATVSKSATTVGTTSVTYPNVTTSGTVAQVFIQGQAVGSTTLTVSAPGYTNGTITVTVNPSGFTFAGSYNGGLSTTSTSNPTQLTVYPTILNPGTLTYSTTGTLNPGLGGISVPIVSSNTAAGTITTSPLVFTDGSTSVNTTFKPVATGTSNITITQPAGFSTPSQYVVIPATVQ